jgi:uncharacterized protein YjiK
MRRNAVSCVVTAAFALLLLPTIHAQSVKVLQRARLGNQTEDITYIPNGPLAGNVALIDGYDVFGIHRGQKPRTLFDVRELGIRISPRGIAYMPSEDLFATNDGLEVSLLFLVDANGAPQGTRTIQYLNGFLPDFNEGLAYIPKSSGVFPDDLILATNSFSLNEARLEVMERDGLVVDEIIPTGFNYITAVAFHAPDRILVSAADNQIWDLDFNGNVVGGPVAIDGIDDIEGLVQLPTGDIAAAAYDAGKLFFFDKNLRRLQGKDRNYKIGVGVSAPWGITWNSDTNQYLVSSTAGLPQTPQIVAIPETLKSATQVVNLAADGFDGRQKLTYLPGKHLIAATVRPSHAIVLFDNQGNQVGQIGVSAFGRPNAICYIPSTKQFVVQFLETPLQLSILDRTGGLVRTIDLSSTALDTIFSVAFFDPHDPSGGRFLVLGGTNSNLALVTDFAGNVKREFNYRDALGVISASDVAAITTGPRKGAFSLVDDDSEIVIFSIQ